MFFDALKLNILFLLYCAYPPTSYLGSVFVRQRVTWDSFRDWRNNTVLRIRIFQR
jgi:hypothetical protein